MAAIKETEINPIEQYFEWYLEELIKYGYLKYFEREPETWLVLPSFAYGREKHFKVKENEVEDFNISQSITYTYDYRLIWEDKAKYIFMEPMTQDGHFIFGFPTFVSHYVEIMDETELVSYVDVKPHVSAAQFGGNLSSYYTFPFIQKILLHNSGVYVNKVTPVNQGKHGVNTCLFAKTFTPNRYQFTDKAQMKRNIKFKTRPITSYVKSQESIVKDLLDQKNSKKNQSKLF